MKSRHAGRDVRVMYVLYLLFNIHCVLISFLWSHFRRSLSPAHQLINRPDDFHRVCVCVVCVCVCMYISYTRFKVPSNR